MPLAKQINEDFLTAFKDKQDTTVSVLRMLKSALTNEEIAKKLAKGKGLPDDEVLAVIKSTIKRNKDSYQSFKDAGRDDLAQKEEKEIAILEKYMPDQMSEEKVKEIIIKVIKDTGASSPVDFGKVMGSAMGQLKGKADGGVISKIVREELNK